MDMYRDASVEHAAAFRFFQLRYRLVVIGNNRLMGIGSDLRSDIRDRIVLPYLLVNIIHIIFKSKVRSILNIEPIPILRQSTFSFKYEINRQHQA